MDDFVSAHQAEQLAAPFQPHLEDREQVENRSWQRDHILPGFPWLALRFLGGAHALLAVEKRPVRAAPSRLLRWPTGIRVDRLRWQTRNVFALNDHLRTKQLRQLIVHLPRGAALGRAIEVLCLSGYR